MATLPFLENIGAETGWYTHTDLLNMLAVSESTPGPIGVNMATYVGNTTSGVLGGILTTIALILPSYLIILAVAKVMDRFRENKYVQNAMQLLRPASVGMVSAAIWGVLKSVLLREDTASWNWSQFFVLPNCLLFAVLLCCCFRFKKLHPLVFLTAGAVAGIVFGL